jgi:carotenoid cleavage dioxygenase-like enzyme
MATPYPLNAPLLSGPFEPIRMECECADLVIEGRMPAELQGTLYRIGPNPQFAPLGAYNPLQGEGMVHAFEIRDGKVAYRNRWVRTERWRRERAAGRALYATTDPRGHDPSVAGTSGDGAANTHIVMHAGRLLALEEGHRPVQMAAGTLETIGPFDFAGRLPGAMTAHPKVCPATGEMWFFTNFPNRRLDGALMLHCATSGGELVRSIEIDGPYPALVHDFAITREHVIFVVCPVTLSVDRLRAHGPPLAWEPDRPAFVGILPRAEAGDGIRWFTAPTTMVWHTVNAWTGGDMVHLDVCQQAAAAFPTADGSPTPEADQRQHLARWTIDLTGDGTVFTRQLSETVCEYPRIDERHLGAPYRYAFVAALGGPGTGDLAHRGLGRYDLQSREMRLWHAGERRTVSEPVFVPRSAAADEGDGFLLATVFDEARNASHLAVLDATAIEAGPVARAHLDHRVPAGFHGSFVAGAPANGPAPGLGTA